MGIVEIVSIAFLLAILYSVICFFIQKYRENG